MPYIQRDEGGAIIGAYANPQPGYAEERVPDDDTALTAFLTPSPTPTITYKADIWRRATDSEAETISALLDAQPVRLRRMWSDSTELSPADEMYPLVLDALTQAFSAKRSRELLAPSA